MFSLISSMKRASSMSVLNTSSNQPEKLSVSYHAYFLIMLQDKFLLMVLVPVLENIQCDNWPGGGMLKK